MNTRRNKIVVTLLAITALLFTGCQEVDDLVSGKTESDIQIDTVTYTISNTELNSKSTVTFAIDVKNLGGLDLAGVTVQAVVDNTPIGFAKTGALGSVANADHKADTTLNITWEAVAGEHSAVFYISNESTTAADATDRIDLEVAVATIAVKETEKVAVEVADEEITAVVTVDEGTSIAEVVEDIDALIATSEDKTDNEVAMLETIKVVSDNGLTISEDKPTVVAFEDTTVSALLIPLATVVVDDVTGEETVVTEEGAFLVAISTEVEEVVSSEVTDAGVVAVTEKKEVTVPLAVKKEESGATTIKNSLGGITINLDGTISVLPVANSRAAADEFWTVMATELETAAVEFTTDLADGVPFISAFTNFMTKFTSILIAYELQTAVTNEKPVIIITASTQSTDDKDGNDKIVTSFDIFSATVEDDKDGATLNASNWVATIPATIEEDTKATFTFTATDSDGEEVSVTVSTGFTVQTIVDFYVHDQGTVN